MKKCLLLILAVVLAAPAYAHLEGQGKTIGDYKIEFSSLPEDLMAGENSDIVLAVENVTTGERMPGVNLWVRISLNSTAYLSSSNFVTDRFGVATVNYIFSDPGVYTLDVIPRPGNEKASFSMQVSGSQPVPLYMAAAAAVFFLGGLAVGFIFGRRTKA